MKAVVTAGLTPVGPLLQAFFVDYLYGQKRASARTVKSYRDTFRLLLRFLQQTTGKAPSALHTLDLDAPVILSFLDHLECQRNNQPQSRNVRLAAVRPFFEWRQSEIQAVLALLRGCWPFRSSGPINGRSVTSRDKKWTLCSARMS